MSLCTMIGMTRPPTDVPAATIPSAVDLRRLTVLQIEAPAPELALLHSHHCETMARAGPKAKPEAMPIAKPWHKRKCQYSVQWPVRMVRTTTATLAQAVGKANQPLSNSLPTKIASPKVNAN